MAEKKSEKPNSLLLRWSGVLIGFQVIYLILELAFNARLVDSVSAADGKYFEYLAHVGRILSGAGCTLLGFSLLQKWQTPSKGLRVAAHILIAAIAFPLVYHGQEKIIDTLVNRSSAEQRINAQYIVLLKRGLASNAVVFKDVEFNAEEVQRPEAKTFINSIGFAVFFAPNYIKSVAENSDQILHQLAQRQANELLPKAYPQYLKLRDEIAALSLQYNEANLEFEQQATAVAPQAREIWRETFIELQQQWSQVRDSEQSKSLKEGLDQLYDKLDLYFTARSRCTGYIAEICLKRLNEQYHETVDTLLGRPVEPEYWCKPLQGQSGKLLQGGQFIESQQGNRLDCNIRHRNFIRERFLQLHGVSSTGYDSFEQFAASAEVASELRAKLAAQGIHMPEHFRLHNHENFIRGVEYELTQQLAAGFVQQAEQKLGRPIEPRLSTEGFLAHPQIQAPLREALGLHEHADTVALNLSERAFLESILVPRLEIQLAKDRARMLARTEFFADGQPYAEDGKMYVRSVLVPPIAMGLSLFFGLLNLGGLMTVLLTRSRLPAVFVQSSKLVFIVLFLALPLLAPSQIARTEPFQKIVDETQSSLGLGRFYVSWLTSLQPVIYPLGAGLANTFNLFEQQP